MYDQSKSVENIKEKPVNLNLRSQKKIKLKSDFTRLTKIQRSPYYRGILEWNLLPDDIQTETNKCRFKERVKTYVK